MAAELWEGVTTEEYRADPSISQSALKDFLLDPQYYNQRYNLRTIPPKDTTPSQQFGKDVEEVAFTGVLNAVTIPTEVMQRRQNADGTVTYAKAGANYTAWCVEQQAIHGNDVRFMKSEDFNKPMGPAAVLQAVENLRGHAFAHRMIWGETERHVRIRWVDDITGLPLKCEIDLLSLLGIIGDLKTARAVTKFQFARSVAQYGYDIQSYFYRDGLSKLAMFRHMLPDTELARAIRPMLDRIADGENLLCCWVAVKNAPSYHVEVHPCDDDWYSIAGPIVRQGLIGIKKCMDSGVWQSPTHGTITDMKPPTFAFNRIEELAGTEE